MALSAEDEQLVAAMKQRELHLKRRQLAAETILYRVRRLRAVVVTLTAVVVAAALTGVFYAVASTVPDRPGSWRLAVLNGVIGAALGASLGQSLLRTKPGRAFLEAEESRLREKFRTDLDTGRRWIRFFHRGEDISAYVPQILYFIEGEGRFDSVEEAVAFVHLHAPESAGFEAQALSFFTDIAAQTNAVVVSSTDSAGHPSSRVMRFVKSDRPGVWFVTTSPEGPKVREFDRGIVAVVTVPTEDGATISSNRVRIRRAGVPFSHVAELYRSQVPGYADGMAEDELDHELVYEIRLDSARVESWLRDEVVEFAASEFPGATPPA